jgi:hypothetical protein
MEASGQLHAPASLHSLRYPLYIWLDRSQNRSRLYEEETNFLPQSGIEPQLLGRPACNLAAITTELSRHLKERQHKLRNAWNNPPAVSRLSRKRGSLDGLLQG